MSNFNSINNGGVPYYFPADIAKEGQQYARFSNWLKTRVNDNGKKVPVKWYDQGRVMNVNGLTPFIQGMVGHFTTDENDELIPSSDVVLRDWQGSPADVTDGGLAFYTLEDQFFCQEGQFKGVFGLRDSNGNVYTSVNIIFEILGNDLRMGETTKYYSSKLDKMVKEFQVRTDEVINDAKASYTNETQTVREALASAQGAIQTTIDTQQGLSTRLAGMQQQIATNDIVTRPEYQQLSNQLTQQVTEMKESGLEFFNTIDDLKAKYPQGANKLCVTLNDSHQWVFDYAQGVWNDAGAYNYGTIDPKLLNSAYQNNSDNLVPNSDFKDLECWTAGRVATDPSVYIDSTNSINGANTLIMNGFVEEGTTNESWIFSQSQPLSGNVISIAAEINIQGLSTQTGDTAGIELNMVDANDNITRWTHNLTNSSDGEMHRVIWDNIVVQPGTVKVYIGFKMFGLGQFKIRRPQLNEGATVLPYSTGELANDLTTSNLLAKYPITKWKGFAESSQIKVDSQNTWKGSKTLSIIENQAQNFNFPESPLIKVTPGSQISLIVPAYGDVDVIHGAKAYLEIDQFDDIGLPENTAIRLTNNVNLNSKKFREISWNDITLGNATTYISVKFVTYGNVNVHVGNIALYQNQFTFSKRKVNQFLLSEQPFVNYPITDWLQNFTLANDPFSIDNTLCDNQGNPTLKVETGLASTLNDYCMINVNRLIPVSKYFAFKFSYLLKMDQAKGNVKVFIRQYSTKNEQLDYSKEIDFNLSPQENLTEVEFDHIKLNTDTRYIDIGVYGVGQFEGNFSNFEKVADSFLEENLMSSLNFSNFNVSEKPNDVDITRSLENVTVQSKNHATDLTYLSSYAIQVVPNSDYVIKLPVEYSTKDDGNCYLEVEQGATPAEALNYNLLTSFNFSKPTKDYTFNLHTGKQTQFISLRFVLYKIASATLGEVKLFKGNKITGTAQNTLPQLDIQTNGEVGSDWQNGQFTFSDKNRYLTGYIQLALQGDSSRGYPKKNFKLKFFEDDKFKKKLKWKPKADWDKNYKFNLKANYIDATQARNLVNAAVFKDATAITPLEHDSQYPLLKSQDLGQMEGFPIELYFNGNYYGLMTFNTKKDDKPYGLDSDNLATEGLTCETSESNLGDPSMTIDGKNYATIVQDTASDDLKNNFKKMLTFIKESSDEDFKAQIGNHIDLTSAMNCMLYGTFSHMWDYPNKSLILLTWNSGISWYITFYDLDSTWNLFWNGSKLTTESAFDFNHPENINLSWGNALFKRIFINFKPELKAQWKKLRTSVWGNNQIISKFKTFINSIPEEAYERDQQKWPDIPSKKITDFAQIQQSIIERGNAMDKFMEGLQ